MATKIPEAIKYPRGLSLSGPWSSAHGSHLTFVASEDFRQTTRVVPSLSPRDADKVALRRLARISRRAYVESLDEQEKSRLEQSLAEILNPLLERSRIVGCYCPLPAEISPMPAMELAKRRGITTAFPAFANHQDPFRFLAGDPDEEGPWSISSRRWTHRTFIPTSFSFPWSRSTGRARGLGRARGTTTGSSKICAAAARCSSGWAGMCN